MSMPGELANTPGEKGKKQSSSQGKPEDSRYWRYEARDERPSQPLEEAWGTGLPLIEGKRLRSRAVQWVPALDEPEDLVHQLMPSYQSESMTAGDEGLGNQPQSQFVDNERPSELDEGLDRTNLGLGDDQPLDTTTSSKDDNYETKVPGSDFNMSEKEDNESEKEVSGALIPDETAQTKISPEGEGNAEDSGSSSGDESDSEDGSNNTEEPEGDDTPVNEGAGDNDREVDDSGWNTVPRRKSASPVNKSHEHKTDLSNEMYFPKDIPVDDLESEAIEQVFVASAYLPAARDVPYDKSRGLESFADQRYDEKPTDDPFFSSEKSREMISAADTGTMRWPAIRDNQARIPSSMFSTLGDYAPPPPLNVASVTTVTGTYAGISSAIQQGGANAGSSKGQDGSNPPPPGGSGGGNIPTHPAPGGGGGGGGRPLGGPGGGGPPHGRPGSPGGSGSSGSRPGSPGPGGGGFGNIPRPGGNSFKLTMPDPYDGREDLDAFDMWKYEVKVWADYYRMTDDMVVRTISKCLSGKARIWYLRFVAEDPINWTAEGIFNGLFNHCFPANYRMKLRERLMNMKQGKRNVREFVREVEVLGRRFRDVNERAIIQIFWNGIHRDLQTALLRKGLNPERDDLFRLIQHAIYEEEANERATRNSAGPSNQNRTEGEKPGRPSRRWGRFKSRVNGPQPFDKNMHEELGRQARQDNVRANAVSPGNRSQKRPDAPAKGKKQIDKGKRDRLRGEGKCFNCEEKGHEIRNCPKLHSMKPPQMRTGSVRFDEMERLSQQRDQADAYVGRIQVLLSDEEGSDLSYEDNELLEGHVHSLCEDVWGEDPLWHDEETRWMSQYTVQIEGENITVWNCAPEKSTYEFRKSDLKDPKFDISRAGNGSSGNKRRASVPKGGSNPTGIYKRWSWPAIYWLRRWLSIELGVQDVKEIPTEDRIDVQPTMTGYSVQIDDEIFYNISHEEVVDGDVRAEWVIEHMMSAKKLPIEERGERFQDRRLTGFHTLMLGMTRLPGNTEKIKRRGSKRRQSQPEGVQSVERTSLRIKDRTRRLPEPIVVNVKINGNNVRALLDTGSMADFLSTTIVDQLKLDKEISALVVHIVKSNPISSSNHCAILADKRSRPFPHGLLATGSRTMLPNWAGFSATPPILAGRRALPLP
jgi:hypothetical protein